MKYRFPLVVLIVLLTIFLFTGFIDSMQISQDTRLSFLPLTITDPDNELIEIAFNYRLADPHKYRLPDPKLIDYLNELTDNEGISAIISGTDFDEIGYTTTYFVKGETYQLDQVIADNLSWDDSHEENYIAVDNPKHPIHMFHFDYTTRRTIIRPWHHLTDYFRSFSGTYKVYLYTPTNAQKYASNPRMHEFLDPLDGFIAQYHTSDVADLIKTNYFQSHSPEIIIVVTSLLIVFLYILFVFDHNKEISVRKLNGQSEIRIVWDLLAPLNILLLSSFLVTTLGLTIYFKTGFNPLSFALYRKMGLIGMVLLVGLICASSIAWFYIRRVNYSALKNTGKQSQTSFVMHAVKVLLLIISISFIASLTDINRGYEYNKEYLNTYPSNSFYTVLLTPEAKNYGVSYDDLKQAMADRTVFLETIQMADLESPEEGKPATFLFQSVVANFKIADYTDIILADGKVFSPKPGKKYLLYPDGMDPMAYFSFPGINQTSEGVEVLEMHPRQRILLPHEYGGPYDYYQQFYFFISDDIESYKYDNYLVDLNIHPWEEFSGYLESQGIPRQAFYPLPKGFSQATRATFHIKLAERNIMIIVYILFVSILMIFSFNRIYVDDHSKRLAISYLFGESHFKRYRMLWISLVLSFSLLLMFFSFFPTIAADLMGLNYSPEMGKPNFNLAHIYKLIGVAFGLDVILSLFFISRLERGVIRALKGGEL